LGKPALTINWGPWSGSGMAANLDARDIQRMNEAGMHALSPEQGLAAMSTLLMHRVPQAGVFDLDWSLIAKQYPDPAQKALFKDFIGAKEACGSVDFISELIAAPADQRESLLTNKISTLLADVLGIESANNIDRDGNVFEYGMNSLMAMDFKNQLQSALKLKLPATLVSKYSTINAMVAHILENELSKLLAGETESESEILLWHPDHPESVIDCEINGPLPFTFLVLHWMNEGKSTHFNGGFMAEFDADKFNLEVLKTTIQILFTYHDGCRLQIFQEEGEFKQEIMPLGDNLRIDEYDFRGLGYEEGAARIRELNAKYHNSFTFTKGDPVFRLAYYQLDDVRPHRFLLLFHHFVTDGISQKIFASQLESTYLKILNRQPVYFPQKRESLIDWTNRLYRFAHQEAVDQIPYWLSVIEKGRLSRIPQKPKTDTAPGKMKYSAINIDLERREYRRLVELCMGQYFEVTDIGAYALIKAFSTLTPAESLWVDLAIRARSNVFDDIDVSNVFGQISEFGSILFELKQGLSLFDQLNSLREQRMQVPASGLGLKALKYVNKDPDIQNTFGDKAPQVILNFDLLDYEEEMPSDWAAEAKEGIGDVDGFDDVMQQIHIRGSIKDGGLSIVFWYRDDIFYSSNVNAIAEEMYSTLMHVANPERTVVQKNVEENVS
jgi:polyketide synthase 12